MNIIILGAPGAGKGTLSTRIVDKYNIAHISTGDIFRENIKNQTELGKLAKSYIDSGTLVPDEVTINLIIDRVKKEDCKNGFILDGFPRNINQAEGFEKSFEKDGKKIDLALLVEADEVKLVKRLAGRRVCPDCGASYHIETLKPKKENICDRCGATLIQRKDDNEEVIKNRLDVYNKETKPLVDYYDKKGILKSVNGFDPIEKTMETIGTFL